jgi:hypothetical protein
MELRLREKKQNQPAGKTQNLHSKLTLSSLPSAMSQGKASVKASSA